MIMVNDGFFNPGGIYDDFDDLLKEIKKVIKNIVSNNKIKRRIKDKINYEGLLTFEYFNNEEDLLAAALYKEIIINEKNTKRRM